MLVNNPFSNLRVTVMNNLQNLRQQKNIISTEN